MGKEQSESQKVNFPDWIINFGIIYILISLGIILIFISKLPYLGSFEELKNFSYSFGFVLITSSLISFILSIVYQSYKGKKEAPCNMLCEITYNNRERCTTYFRNLVESGVEAFYPYRRNRSDDELGTKMSEIANCQRPITIKIVSSTLRVFFNAGQPFYGHISSILEQNNLIKFRVLLLNMNSIEALYRASSESGPYEDDKSYMNSPQFLESSLSVQRLNELRKRYTEERIDFRFYNHASYVFLVIFDDECFVSQNILGDRKAQNETVKLPMLRFKKTSLAYDSLTRYFDYSWNISREYEDVKYELANPNIVNEYREGGKLPPIPAMSEIR